MYSIGVPVATFILGIFAQVLFDQWIGTKSVIPLGLAFIMISFVITFIILGLSDKRFDMLEHQLHDIKAHTGLSVDFIVDHPSGGDGSSYKQTTKLIEEAESSIVMVSSWEPFSVYLEEIDNPELKNARTEYYNALKKKITLHQSNTNFLHCRIIQLSGDNIDGVFKFKTDSQFYTYLKLAADIQETHPTSCQLRRTYSFVEIQFTIIDKKHIIIPIFSHDGTRRLTRYGALIFHDTHGNLVRCLYSLYEELWARSYPIKNHQLVALQGLPE